MSLLLVVAVTEPGKQPWFWAAADIIVGVLLALNVLLILVVHMRCLRQRSRDRHAKQFCTRFEQLLAEHGPGRDRDTESVRRQLGRLDELERPVAASILIERLNVASPKERERTLEWLRQVGADGGGVSLCPALGSLASRARNQNAGFHGRGRSGSGSDPAAVGSQPLCSRGCGTRARADRRHARVAGPRAAVRRAGTGGRRHLVRGAARVRPALSAGVQRRRNWSTSRPKVRRPSWRTSPRSTPTRTTGWTGRPPNGGSFASCRCDRTAGQRTRRWSGHRRSPSG
jgi:hypothetical protein